MTAVVPLLTPLPLAPRSGAHPAHRRAGGRPLPLPTLAIRRARATVYGLAGVDDRGRIADRIVIRALGWTEHTRLDVRVDDGGARFAARDAGELRLAGRDRVRLPVWVRRGCGIEPGDRVLLAAEPADGVLTIHPPAILDAMLNAFARAATLGGVA